jgi:hypothetical protein
MSKPRLLIPMSVQFSVRYLLRTGLLQRMTAFAQPVVLLAWKDEDLRAELEEVGAEVYTLIEARRSKSYQRVRSLINIWYKKQLNSPSGPIWERRADAHRDVSYKIRRRVRKQIFHTFFALPGAVKWLLAKERSMVDEHTNLDEIRRQMDALKPDAALTLTPFLANEEMALRGCMDRRLPVCASILSFDNITSQGWLPLTFDQYLVWNRYDVEALLRGYPQVSEDRISVVGSPQFDFYWNPRYLWSEEEWRSRIGLPQGRRVILFGGGHYFCAPHEPNFLLQLDRAIESGELPRDAVILFRCHPVDPIERWLPVLEQTKHVIRDDPWKRGRISGHANVRDYDIQKLASTLHHSAVHVNVASTMSIDGAILDRPQVGPAYDDTPGGKFDRTAREVYLQEHYLPITNSGGLDVVRSREELIAAVRSGLDNPGRLAEGRKKLVREICTFDDGKSTERVLAAARSFLDRTVAEDREPAGVRVAQGQ